MSASTDARSPEDAEPSSEASPRAARAHGRVVEQLRTLGVEPSDLLVVHTSFRAVRPLEDGPAGLIESLQQAVTPEGSLLMPSWPEHATEPFDPDHTPVSTDLGIVAETFRRMPDVLRAGHAASFAAWGAHAQDLLQDPMPIPPHRLESPVGRAWQHDAKILLLGVGHDANTTIHLAEVLAGVRYGIEHRCRIHD